MQGLHGPANASICLQTILVHIYVMLSHLPSHPQTVRIAANYAVLDAVFDGLAMACNHITRVALFELHVPWWTVPMEKRQGCFADGGDSEMDTIRTKLPESLAKALVVRWCKDSTAMYRGTHTSCWL